MPGLRIVHDESCQPPLRFPIESARENQASRDEICDTNDVLEALETASRRIDDLARELNCLGWFDDDDRPRAA